MCRVISRENFRISPRNVARGIRPLGAVYMTPVCRDETLWRLIAGLKVKKEIWRENALTRKVYYERSIHALLDNFIKGNKNFIKGNDVENSLLCRKIFISTIGFVLNEVFVLNLTNQTANNPPPPQTNSEFILYAYACIKPLKRE